MCVLVLVDIKQNLHLEKHGTDLSESASMRFRLYIWSSAVVASVAVYSSLQYVTALIGAGGSIRASPLPHLPKATKGFLLP